MITGDYQREMREDFPKLVGPLFDTPNADPGNVKFSSHEISLIAELEDRISVNVEMRFTCMLDYLRQGKNMIWQDKSPDAIDCSLAFKKKLV